MGTRSRIAIRNADNTYLSVYCHWDGYPSHHGPILQEHYNSEDKVRALLAGGDFSSLESNFDLIKFYTTTRPHEDPSPAAVSADLDALCVLTQETGGEWLYVFTPAGWQCAPGGFSAFGMPSTKKPEGLESVDYWLQREAHDSRCATLHLTHHKP